jgi:catechol 2,3-dioxygenase-like lactoylglutathione lyase family enzyme
VSLQRLGWLGVRTDRFDEMKSLFEDMFALEPFQVDDTSARYSLADGTELHVYGPADNDHEFFGSGPVVGFVVDDAALLRRRMEEAGIAFLTPLEQAGGSTWCHFRGPDGSVYEIISGDD